MKFVDYIYIIFISVSFVIPLIKFVLEKTRIERQRFAELSALKQAQEVLSAEMEKATLDFEILQTKEELLKKNTGSDLCEDCPPIEYVEYCDSLKYN